MAKSTIKLPSLEQMQDILDIKESRFLDLTWIKVLFLSLVAAIVFYAIFALWKRWRRRNPLRSTPALSPLEQALASLNALLGKKYIELGQFQKFYFELSELFRRFMEEQMGLAACEATLEEIKQTLKEKHPISREQIQEALWLLELADLAKFAKFQPSKAEVIQSIKTCRRWMSEIGAPPPVLQEA